MTETQATYDNSGPAYPQVKPFLGETVPRPGMSKREVFAAHALAGYCANPQVFINTTPSERAIVAVAQADEMLKVLGIVEPDPVPVPAQS